MQVKTKASITQHIPSQTCHNNSTIMHKYTQTGLKSTKTYQGISKHVIIVQSWTKILK